MQISNHYLEHRKQLKQCGAWSHLFYLDKARSSSDHLEPGAVVTFLLNYFYGLLKHCFPSWDPKSDSDATEGVPKADEYALREQLVRFAN